LTFDDQVGPGGRVRREQRTPDDAVVIAHVGRMVPLKGHRALIAALGLLPVDAPWVCWFVGAPQRPEEVEYERTLRQQVAALGLTDRIRFLGAREDVAAVLADADIYCQPNEAPEAFGLSLVEALRAGLPVVTTHVEGTRDIVTDACGLFAPPRDAHALADRLRSLLIDPSRRINLGKMGPLRARALCDPATALVRLERAIARVSIGAAA
jgi:glycosyltransferase involved in cell wall biosynthesis